jgi:hypothetical protein
LKSCWLKPIAKRGRKHSFCVRDSAIKALLYIHNFSFPRIFPYVNCDFSCPPCLHTYIFFNPYLPDNFLATTPLELNSSLAYFFIFLFSLLFISFSFFYEFFFFSSFYTPVRHYHVHSLHAQSNSYFLYNMYVTIS